MQAHVTTNPDGSLKSTVPITAPSPLPSSSSQPYSGSSASTGSSRRGWGNAMGGHNDPRQLSDRQLQEQLIRQAGNEVSQTPRDDPMVLLLISGVWGGREASMLFLAGRGVKSGGLEGGLGVRRDKQGTSEFRGAGGQDAAFGQRPFLSDLS